MADLSNKDKGEFTIVDPDNDDYELAVNSDGSLNNRTPGDISSGNSTTTPLGASGVFTGTGEEVLGYSAISVYVVSDQDSATDGIELQFSTDGTNWETDDTHSFLITDGNRAFDVSPIARYFRIKYTNGAVAQTVFRMQVIYKQSAPALDTKLIDEDINRTHEAVVVKAVISGRDAITSDYANVKVRDQRLLVSQDIEAPAGTTSVITTGFGSVASTSGVDTYYTITNGEALTIQRLDGGSEENTGGSVVELFYDPNANLTGMTRLGTIYVNGASDTQDINQTFTGDGTKRIVLRRRGFSSNAREMFAKWTGFEE